MDYRRFGDTILVRIDRGEEILEEMKKVALAENVKLAEVSALGAVNDFTVGVFNTVEKKYYANHFEGPFEITSLTGYHQHHERRVLCAPAHERRQQQR